MKDSSNLDRSIYRPSMADIIRLQPAFTTLLLPSIDSWARCARLSGLFRPGLLRVKYFTHYSMRSVTALFLLQIVIRYS